MHHCDNLPTVMAYARLKQGKFSTSARIAAFLTTVNEYDVQLVHTAGKDLPLTDYVSRHPMVCEEKRCQTCNFVKEQVDIGNTLVNKVTVEDILQGKFSVPYLQPRTWVALQKKDNVLNELIKLIQAGQKPEVKRTRGENTVLKLLHGQYVKGNLKIAPNGLITVSGNDESGIPRNQVVVPSKLFPGLLSALHHKLQHPTKYQMGKLVGRYFYCPGATALIAECVDNCHTCLSLKSLPPAILSETSTQSEVFGTRFSMDVMKRNGQTILFMVELLTQFCWICILENERAETIKDAVLRILIPYIHQQGATMRCDGAPSFQSLNNQTQSSSDVLAEFNVGFELG